MRAAIAPPFARPSNLAPLPGSRHARDGRHSLPRHTWRTAWTRWRVVLPARCAPHTAPHHSHATPPRPHSQVASIHSHSDSAGDQTALLSQLRQHEAALPSAGRTALLQALAALDPKRHTLGYLFLLCVPLPLLARGCARPTCALALTSSPLCSEALHHTDAPPDALITATSAALRAADPAQAKLAPDLCAWAPGQHCHLRALLVHPGHCPLTRTLAASPHSSRDGVPPPA